MHSCFCRHRALAFGGGNGSKNGSMIKKGKIIDKNPIKDIVNNSNYTDEDYISMSRIKKIQKIKVPEEEEYDAEDVDLFDQYGILVYT